MPASLPTLAPSASDAIVWASDRTLANAPPGPEVTAGFPAGLSTGALLPCELVAAGKMRNGAAQSWCRTHQKHWGTKADIAAALSSGVQRCAFHAQAMSVMIGAPVVDLDAHPDVTICCALPPALGTIAGPARARIAIDQHIFEAVVLRAEGKLIQVSPLAALEFSLALEAGRELGCVDCRECGHPHWDMGEFASAPHRKHLCANCGRHTTWSKTAFVSTPLAPLHARYRDGAPVIDADASIDLDDYRGAVFALWATITAIIRGAAGQPPRGIRVQIASAQHSIDATFGSVRYQGQTLRRADLWQAMLANISG